MLQLLHSSRSSLLDAPIRFSFWGQDQDHKLECEIVLGFKQSQIQNWITEQKKCASQLLCCCLMQVDAKFKHSVFVVRVMQFEYLKEGTNCFRKNALSLQIRLPEQKTTSTECTLYKKNFGVKELGPHVLGIPFFISQNYAPNH